MLSTKKRKTARKYRIPKERVDFIRLLLETDWSPEQISNVLTKVGAAIRNLQQIADYSGKGHTAKIGQHLVLLSKLVFRTRHRWEAGKIDDALYLNRLSRLRYRFNHWLFLTNPKIPLTATIS